MASSLRVKLYELKFRGLITEAEYQKFMKELDDHDRKLTESIFDRFADRVITMMPGHKQDILRIAENLKEILP